MRALGFSGLNDKRGTDLGFIFFCFGKNDGAQWCSNCPQRPALIHFPTHASPLRAQQIQIQAVGPRQHRLQCKLKLTIEKRI